VPTRIPEPQQAAEAWFRDHGLTYFVPELRRSVRDELRARRTLPVLVAVVVVAAAVGIAVAWLSGEVTTVPATLVTLVLLAALGYGLVRLHAAPILRWALHRTFGSIFRLLPMTTRALPLLLLAITFLFINTEVWQVASALDRGYLWLTVMMFAAIAVVFLLVRLPEEVREVSERARGEQLAAICTGTPVEAAAAELARSESAPSESAPFEPSDDMSRLRQVNLVLVLLFAQALQVLLLSMSVFVFFIVFGMVAIKDSVVRTWLGDPSAPHPLPTLDWLPVSNELFQVSVFLAAFSGLYFTVYAVTDETYRREFFSDIAEELETAVGVQRVYLRLVAHDR